MKKMNWVLILLMLANLVVFFGYQALVRIRTDTTAPEIEISSQLLELSVQEPKTALLQGVSAKDNRDGDVTDSLVIESISMKDRDGTVTVGYAAFDKAGNVTKAEREVRYTDYKSPKFTVKGPLIYPYGTTFDVLSTVGAKDFLDGDIQHRVRASAMEEDTISGLGIHNVQFQVTNSLGDTVKLVLPVEVYSADEYNARMTLKEYLIYVSPGAVFVPEAYLDTFMVMGKEISLRAGLPEDYELDTTGQVMSQYPGVYPVEYRVTYTQRNRTNPELDQKYVAYSKLIVVVEE